MVFIFVLKVIINCLQRSRTFALCHRPSLYACSYVRSVFPKALVSTNGAIVTFSNKFSCFVRISVSATMKQSNDYLLLFFFYKINIKQKTKKFIISTNTNIVVFLKFTNCFKTNRLP